MASCDDDKLDLGHWSQLKPERSFERWRDEISPVFTVDAMEGADRFEGRLKARNLGSLIIGQAVATALTCRRDQTLIARGDIDHIMVRSYVGGSAEVEAEGHAAVVHPGDLVCLDLARPFTLTSTHAETVAVILPRAGLDIHPRIIDELHGAFLQGGTAVARILANHLRSASRLAEDIVPDERAQLAHVTALLLSSCLSSRGGTWVGNSFPRRSPTLGAILHMIDRRIGDPTLSPESVMRDLGLSRSALYRLFKDQGGIAHYIRDKRLKRARSLLRSQAVGPGGIKGLAARAGFPNEAAFGRAFKAEFGNSVADALKGSAMPPTPQPGRGPNGVAFKLETWLERMTIAV